MGRRKAHAPLAVMINNRRVGRLEKEAGGAVTFQYDPAWLDWPPHFPISLSMPVRPTAYRGETMTAVFDNLLPDNTDVRRRVAERTGAAGTDAYSLLAEIGRDCVGALQVLPEDIALDALAPIEADPISDADIEALLANLARAPLGMDQDNDFRISVAGAQEKTALLFHEGQWKRPLRATATTHILKPQIGEIPTASGLVDMSNSVDNEHYCLQLLRAFGLKTANTQIATFGAKKVLVVERFDRLWRGPDQLIRLPQEDCCQALSIPPGRKYQNQGGPGAVDILKLLQGSDDPLRDQTDFLKSQILFWLIGATDGHGKNFSLALRPGGRFALTPFYDVLTVQQGFNAKQISHAQYKLAMSAGATPHYRILDVHGRHFVETAQAAGLGSTIIRQAVDEIFAGAATAPDAALAAMPHDFHTDIHTTVVDAINARIDRLQTAFEAL